MTRPTPASASMPLAFAMIAALLIAVACALPAHAFAEETGADEPPIPKIVGSFDKDAYEPGDQAVVTFSVANNTPVTWNKVRLETQLPQGVKLARDGDVTAREADTLAAGETIELKLNVLFESSLFKRLAPTGDSGSAAGIALAAAAAAGFIALAAATFSRKQARSRRAKGTMGALMSVVLVAGLAPLVPREAHADEASEQGVFTGSAFCQAPSTAVTARLTIGGADFEPLASIASTTVSVSDGQAVSANANSVEVDLVSTKPFAANMPNETLSLGGAFSDLTVDSITRTDETHVTVRLGGGSGDAGTDGYLAFGAGAFQDPQSKASAFVALETAEVFFDLAAEETSYDQNSGVFAIPISVNNGRFARAGGVPCCTFADERLLVSSWSVDPDNDRNGILRIDASAAGKPLEQFNALIKALDGNGTILFDPRAFIGEPGTVLVHRETAPDGSVLSAAADVDAVPYGSVHAVAAQRDEAAGTTTVQGEVRFAAVQGSVSITNVNQITLPQQGATDDSGLFERLPVTITGLSEDGAGFDFSFAMDNNFADQWWGAYQELDPGEALDLFLTDLTSLMGGSLVDLGPGTVINDYGIPQNVDACEISLSSGTLPSVANVRNSTTDDAKLAFEILESLASAIGYFASGGGGIAAGFGSIFGLFASLLDDPEFTLADIYSKLEQMDGKLTRMETSIDQIAVQLQAVDKKAGFISNWYEAKKHIDRLDSYSGLYMTLMEKTDRTGTEDFFNSFDKLSPSNQKLFKSFSKAAEKKNALLNTTVLADTRDLGNLITGLGENTMEEYYTWIETYYNWDPETFDAKYLYLTTLLTAYIYGYSTSMVYLNTLASDIDPDDPFENPFDNPYSQEMDSLKQQANQVIKLLVGEVSAHQTNDGFPAVSAKSDYRVRAEQRTDGQVRCLMDDRLYNPSTFLARNIYNDGAPDRNFKRSIDEGDCRVYQFDGTLNLAQWQQMWKNLSQVRNVKGFEGATSITEELRLLGFSNGAYGDDKPALEDLGNWEGKKTAATHWYWREHGPNIVAIGSAAFGKCGQDMKAVYHFRETHIDVFDLSTGRVTRNLLVGRHCEQYQSWLARWGYSHYLYPVRAV